MTPAKTIQAPLIPMRDVVVFPHTMFPFIIGRDSSIKALEYALRHDRQLFLATQKDPTIDDPKPDDIYDVGTLTLMIQNLKLPEGNIKVLVEGLRARPVLRSIRKDDGFYMVEARLFEETAPSPVDEEAVRKELTGLSRNTSSSIPSFNLDARPAHHQGHATWARSPTTCGNLPVSIQEKQQLLEIADPADRLRKIIELIQFEIEKIKIDKYIQGRVKRADGEGPEGVLPPREDQGHPEGAGRGASRTNSRS